VITNLVHSSSEWTAYTMQNVDIIGGHHLFYVDIKLYLADIHDLTNILSEQELKKSKRFLKKEDAENFLARRHALRMILMKFLNIDPKEIEYFPTFNKKPAVTGINFNTSHTKDYAVIAISGYPVGIDLEYCESNFDPDELIQYCFSQQEHLYIKCQTSIQEGFYTLWTRKEALIKATGEGLVRELKEVSVIDNEISRMDQHFAMITFRKNQTFISLAYNPSISKVHLWDFKLLYL
jgi:4'-phosphopantetheinyl transferase